MLSYTPPLYYPVWYVKFRHEQVIVSLLLCAMWLQNHILTLMAFNRAVSHVLARVIYPISDLLIHTMNVMMVYDIHIMVYCNTFTGLMNLPLWKLARPTSVFCLRLSKVWANEGRRSTCSIASLCQIFCVATDRKRRISMPWWRHHMETFSVLLAICAGNSPVPMNSKGQWRGALMFSLICARMNGWVNNGEAGDLRLHWVHYDLIVMWYVICSIEIALHNSYREHGQHVVWLMDILVYSSDKRGSSSTRKLYQFDYHQTRQLQQLVQLPRIWW